MFLYRTLITLISLNAAAASLPDQMIALLKSKEQHFMISAALPPFSFDPLVRTKHNSRTMSMLYATPAEFDEKGRLTSSIFEEFSYDEVSRTIILKNIKDTATFDQSGRKITLQDVALSFKRVLLNSPDLAELKDLVGKEKWLKTNKPLLHEFEGISIDEKHATIKLKYTRAQENPLLRLTFRIFFIQPEENIDKETNALRVERPDFSGKYRLCENILGSQKLTYPTFIKFCPRQTTKKETVWFSHVSPQRIINYMDFFHDGLVIVSNEVDIFPTHRKQIENKLQVVKGPNVTTGIIYLNFAFEPFKEERTRQYFAKLFREEYEKMGYPVSGSLFTPSMQGFVDLSTLDKSIPAFSKNEIDLIEKKIRANPPKWVRTNQALFETFEKILFRVFTRIGINPSNIEFSSEAPSEEAYLALWEAGKITAAPTYWEISPMAPTENMKMFFTPGLNSRLNFITRDRSLVRKVNNIRKTHLKDHVDFNKFIFKESKIVVITNFSQEYFASKNRVFKYPYKYCETSPELFFR